MEGMRLIETGSRPPEEIMAIDAALLAELDPEGPPLLHLYEWDRPCLTYGYFTNPTQYLNLDALRAHGIALTRRPTGGGIIFHLTDLAFSVLIPAKHPKFSLNTLDNYVFVNQWIAQSIGEFIPKEMFTELLPPSSPCGAERCVPFCMAKPTPFDIMVEGKKIGGAAQRRTKLGLLHQGSLSLFPPPVELLSKVIEQGESVVQAIKEKGGFVFSVEPHDSNAIREKLREKLAQSSGLS